jgi:ribose transport system permease protein
MSQANIRQSESLTVKGRTRTSRPIGLALTALVGLAALLIVGAILQPRSLTAQALLSVLPFFAILGIASVGQHLVIQQRGLDISVAGMISLATVLVTALPPNGTFAEVFPYLLLALAVGLVGGLVNGVFVTYLRVPSLVTTIGSNAILFGLVLHISDGKGSEAPAVLGSLALSKTLGIPNTVIVMAVFAATAWVVLNKTMMGRRFLAIGISPEAAAAIALPVNLYRCGTYAIAGFCYAFAGIILAGYLNIPGLYSGSSYILATIAAVVVGGNPLGGGRSSIVATIIGCAFLTYLDQLVLSIGYPTAAQYAVQAVVVLGAVGLGAVLARTRGGAEPA